MGCKDQWREIADKLKSGSPEGMEHFDIPWGKLKQQLQGLNSGQDFTGYQREGKAQVLTSYKRQMDAYEIMLLLDQGDYGDADGFGVEPDHWGVAYLDEEGEFLSAFVSSKDKKGRERQYTRICLIRRKEYFIGALLGAASVCMETIPVYLAAAMGLAYSDSFDAAYQKGMTVDFESERRLVHGVSTMGLFAVILAGLLRGYRLYDARNIAFSKLPNGSLYRDYLLKSYTSNRAEKKEMDENLLLEPLREIPGEAGSLMTVIYAFFWHNSDYEKALQFIKKYRGTEDAAVAMGGAILGALTGTNGILKELKPEDNKITAITEAAEAIHMAVVARL